MTHIALPRCTSRSPHTTPAWYFVHIFVFLSSRCKIQQEKNKYTSGVFEEGNEPSRKLFNYNFPSLWGAFFHTNFPLNNKYRKHSSGRCVWTKEIRIIIGMDRIPTFFTFPKYAAFLKVLYINPSLLIRKSKKHNAILTQRDCPFYPDNKLTSRSLLLLIFLHELNIPNLLMHHPCLGVETKKMMKYI